MSRVPADTPVKFRYDAPMRDRPLYLSFLAFLTAFLWAVLADTAVEHLRFLEPRHALRYAAGPVAFFLMFLWPVLQGRDREGTMRAAVRRAAFQIGGLSLLAVVPVRVMGGMATIDGPELVRCGSAVGSAAVLGFFAVLLAHRRPERLPWAILLFALWCAGAPLADVVGGDLENRENWGFWRRMPFGVLAAAEGAGAGFWTAAGLAGAALLGLLEAPGMRRAAGAVAAGMFLTLGAGSAGAEDPAGIVAILPSAGSPPPERWPSDERHRAVLIILVHAILTGGYVVIRSNHSNTGE